MRKLNNPQKETRRIAIVLINRGDENLLSEHVVNTKWIRVIKLKKVFRLSKLSYSLKVLCFCRRMKSIRTLLF